MKRNIFIKKLNCKPIDEQEIEIVERKGLGHPDSLADGIAESVSRALCKMYIEKFNTILHHNTDQVEVVGGHAYPRFGGGEMVSPIYILLSGRATTQIIKENGEVIKLPVGTVAIKAAKEHLKKVLRNLDVEKDVIIDCRIGQGSSDLIDVFERQKNKVPLANDTSFGVGYAPLSVTERLVLETERFLNSEELKKEIPAVGEDIKVMGLREGKKIKLTIAMAVVDKYVKNLEEYKEVINKVREKVRELAKKIADGYDVEIYINTADDYENGSVYITVTGTSAEMGDDGSVGRGNRVNGLITPFRPMSMEAASGKNPVNHVGKIYNILANLIANDIAKIEGVREVYVRILSQIGKPINEPKALDIELIVDDNYNFDEIKKKAEEIANNWLDNIMEVQKLILENKVSTF
ncbi:methionine adenosyltransferase [Methanocaldococcus infernus]|uniref:S-adenosylmethionine synthase n=1 Tax=Methanocaldococcus infernus (strain DSM 11812 / JCM 15783 / ME) TaxID=573063 RepID=D5VTB4_METIM|nr:methionine adenosyltransferase [Methanocaldococcus infernus]ADG13817.1 Methionine adenosyltransferase [Methanocaldococcus infernus ME]